MKTFKIKVTDDQGQPAEMTLRLGPNRGLDPTPEYALAVAKLRLPRDFEVLEAEEVSFAAQGCI